MPTVRIWYDHCLQRVPNPWSIQYTRPNGGGIKTLKAWSFWIYNEAPERRTTTPVEGLQDPPVLEMKGVDALYVTDTQGATERRIELG
jgi:hypothetical protein